MAAEGPTARLVARLEARVVHSLGAEHRAVLAFSGGLGSLLAAAIARKRCDLLCRTVGADNAPDVERARVLAGHLDYRVEIRGLPPREAVLRARALGARHPRWTDRQILDGTVLEAAQGDDAVPVLAGFAGPRLPLRVLFPDGVASRRRLVTAARLLGVPEAFARARHRSPSLGSGLGPAIAALARDERTTVRRLLRGRKQGEFGP